MKRKQCPKCAELGNDTKKDNFTVYDRGGGYCFACGYYENDGSKGVRMNKESSSVESISRLSSHTLFDRALKQKTTSFYGVKSEFEGESEIRRLYPRTSKGIIVGYKARILPKNFTVIGDSGTEFFGQHLFSGKGNMLIVTAGEEDAMSSFQMTEACSPKKRGYASVSLPNGIDSKKTIKDNLEWINSFERVVFAVDQEEAEIKKAVDYCSLLSPGKGKIARFSAKDASEMCVQHRAKEFYNAVWEAADVAPSGIVEKEQIWEQYTKKQEYTNLKFPDSWGMGFSYGLMIPSLVVLTAGTSNGKSTVNKLLQYNVFKNTDKNIGVISMEEPISICAGGLMGIHLNKRIMLPDSSVTEEETRKSYEDLYESGRFIFCERTGIRSVEDLLSKIRFMAISRDCGYIFLDHITAVIRNCKVTENISAVEYSDYITTKLDELCLELKICIVLVAHVRKTYEGGSTYETGKIPSEDSVWGSSALKQAAHMTLAIERNKSDPESHTFIHVLKDRLGGKLGKSCALKFDENTGHLIPALDFSKEIVI